MPSQFFTDLVMALTIPKETIDPSLGCKPEDPVPPEAQDTGLLVPLELRPLYNLYLAKRREELDNGEGEEEEARRLEAEGAAYVDIFEVELMNQFTSLRALLYQDNLPAFVIRIEHDWRIFLEPLQPVPGDGPIDPGSQSPPRRLN